ncbi:uncharacterized protein LOC119067549 [Bradysia coprophila]|uniref:uncharacterized protein LOC119067549 n=1 Tax=Bradysia coprophila TaxID=38358 RepID=UPI00187DC8DA|nr:uncharacterized protein LOC119067549 [Bradysia coprophila]
MHIMMNRINNLAIYVDIGVDKLKIYLTVLDSLHPTYYYGELQFSYFEYLSDQLEKIVTSDDCKTESICALTTRNGLPHFTYKFDANTSRFVWSRKIKGCPFDLYYGQTDMTPSRKAATIFLYANLMDNLTNHTQRQRNENDKQRPLQN